jgi:putative aldouronate transport system substrate-binding protein
MKKTVKIISRALAALLTLSVILTGCGQAPAASSATPTPAASSNNPTQPAEVNPTEKFVELNFYYPGSTKKELQVVNDEINKYLKEKLNCSLALMPQDWSVWSQKYPLLLQSGEQVDLIFTSAENAYFQNVPKNAYQPLNELLEKYGQGIKSVINPVYLEAAKVDGELYAIGVNKDLGQSNGIFFRKDIADKYGFDVQSIKGLEDLEPMLATIKEKEPSFIPFYMIKGCNPEFRFVLTRALYESKRYEFNKTFRYIAFDKQTKKFVNALEIPEYIDMMKLLRSWYEKGYINKDATTAQTSEHDTFKAGKSWLFLSTSQPGQLEFFRDRNGFELYMKDMGDGLVSTDGACGALTAIGRTSADSARAMMVLNLGYADEYFINLFHRGVEGKHYVKKSANVISLPQGFKTWDDTGWNPGVNWEFGNQFMQYLKDTDDPQKFVKLDAYNKSLKEAELLGFYFNTANIITEVAAVNNAWSQFDSILGTGSDDAVKTINAANEKMKANGLDKMIAEFQGQYDKWAAANK